MDAGRDVLIVRELFRAVERRDLRPMLAIYDEAVEVHEAPSLPYGGHFRGHAGIVEHGRRYASVWDPIQTRDDRGLEAEFHSIGDRVLVRWRQKAHVARGSLDHPMLSEYRLRAGRVIESRMHAFDSAALVAFLAEAGSAGTAR